MKITSFIIALILVSVVATTFTIANADFTTKYGKTYDDETLATFEATEELTNLTQSIKEKEESQPAATGITDLVGDYIGKAVDTLKVAKGSLNVFDAMVDDGTEKIGLPSYFKGAFIMIALVLIIIGVIVSAMVKRDL